MIKVRMYRGVCVGGAFVGYGDRLVGVCGFKRAPVHNSVNAARPEQEGGQKVFIETSQIKLLV